MKNQENQENQVVIRNSISGMMKHGRWRAFRNMPVGWVTQSVHSTDRSEMIFRILLELLVMVVVAYLTLGGEYSGRASMLTLAVVLVSVHSVSWLLVGSFWVYMLDSFDWVQNGGIENVIRYVRFVERVYIDSDSCDAILIYGSMARNRFHNRSDLDLRILRRTDSPSGIMAIILAAYVKSYAFFIRMPVDLQVVDSFDFLEKQMRADEPPIVVYRREHVAVQNAGPNFSAVEESPESVLK